MLSQMQGLADGSCILDWYDYQLSFRAHAVGKGSWVLTFGTSDGDALMFAKDALLSAKDVTDAGREILHALNVSIADELLQDDGYHLTEDEINHLLVTCKGNPWDVPIIYKMQRLAQAMGWFENEQID
jgi:hypothetical protein